jgi:SAM-dependent methyltransferase
VSSIRPPAAQLNETALLHHGEADAGWGNLGDWGVAAQSVVSYPQAAQALARRVTQAAELRAGHRVLFVGCGLGEELRWACGAHGLALAVGVEADAALAEQAQRRAAADAGGRWWVEAGDALDLDAALARFVMRSRWSADERFDAIVSVDAAYHFSPRDDWLQGAARWLKPGGRLAFTDLTLGQGRDAPPWRWARRAAGAMAGVNASDLLACDEACRRVESCGFVEVRAEDLGAPVLDGFVDFVQRHSAVLAQAMGLRLQHPAAVAGQLPGWRRVVATAGLMSALRRGGLSYTLFAARTP